MYKQHLLAVSQMRQYPDDQQCDDERVNGVFPHILGMVYRRTRKRRHQSRQKCRHAMDADVREQESNTKTVPVLATAGTRRTLNGELSTF